MEKVETQGIPILVVDDESGMRNFLSYELGEEGFRVTTAEDGQEAVDLIKKENFQLIISDIKMPRMDGIELLEAVKKTNPEVEVILTTGYGTVQSAVDSMKKGAYDFVQKPFKIGELKGVISKALERSELKTLVGLYESSKAVFSISKVKDLCEVILGIVQNVLKVDRCSLMLMGPDKKLYLTAGRGLGESESEAIQLGERIAGRVAEDKKGRLLVKSLREYPEFNNIETSPDVGSSIVCPLLFRDEVIGVMNLTRSVDQEVFNETDFRCATVFAAQVAQAVQNAKLYESLEGKIDEVKSAYHKLEEAQDQIVQSEKLASIGRLVSGVAHEINNPLTSIIGYSQLMLESKPEEKMNEPLSIIFEEARRCCRIVQDLLAFSRQSKIKSEPLDIRKVLDECIKIIHGRLDLKQIKIETQYPENCPNVPGDKDRLKLVFINILENACKAVKQNQDKQKIHISMTQTEQNLEINIEDNGPGISEEDLPKVFDPFYTTREVGQGTGLGLSLSYGIMQQHKGNLRVASQSGRGAIFTAEIPLPEEELKEIKEKEKRVPIIDPSSFKGVNTIYIIEDELSILNLVEQILAEIGAEVVKFSNPEEALAALDVKHPDLIISDYRLPKLDGVSFFSKMKEKHPELASRFMMITGSVVMSQLKVFLKESQVVCVRKPFTREELTNALRSVWRKC